VTFLDRSVRRISILPSKDFCSFVFEVLVNREKMLDFLQYVRLNFCVVLNAAETRIASRVSENFFIRNSLVEHFKEADWPRKVNAPRKGWSVSEDENIQRAPILGERPWNEPIVTWIMHWRMQIAIQSEDLHFLVVFVFVDGALRNLDHCRDDFRCVLANR